MQSNTLNAICFMRPVTFQLSTLHLEDGRSNEKAKQHSNYFILVIFLLFFLPTFSQDSITKNRPNGFIDINTYYDTREFSTLTINLLANITPSFEYFSFTNFNGNNYSSDLSTYYGEHHLRWNFHKKLPLDLTQAWITTSGSNNDKLKYGLRWKCSQTTWFKNWMDKIHLIYFINFHFLGFSETAPAKSLTRIDHFYRLQVFPKKLPNRIYFSGFANQDWYWNNGKVTFKWVSEHQLGFRVAGDFYLVTEFRINQYMNKQYGVGFGLEYIVNY